MSNSQQLNDKIQNGLHAQFSADRIVQIIQQAHSVYHYRNPHTQNSAELYELFEAGYIDEALQALGFGKWAIGRPKIGNGHAESKPKLGVFHHKTPTLSNQKSQPQPTTPDNLPELEQSLREILPELPNPKNSWDNATVHVHVLVVGGQGTGKDTVAHRIGEIVESRYPNEAFLGQIQRANVDRLLSIQPRYRHGVRVLAGNDLTLAKIENETLNNWFQVRHLSGIRRGMIASLSMIHTFFGLNKNIRTDFHSLILKSIPSTPYDRGVIGRIFGKEQVAEFQRLRASLPYEDRNRVCLAWFRDLEPQVRILRVDYPKSKILSTVESIESTQLPGWFFGFLFLATFAIAFPIMYLFWEWLK